jgi:hypothetical protein
MKVGMDAAVELKGSGKQQPRPFGIYNDLDSALKSKIPLQKLSAVVSPTVQKEALLSYWSVVSLVCALLTTMVVSRLFFLSFCVLIFSQISNFFFPPDFNQFRDNDDTQLSLSQVRAYSLISGCSFIFVFNSVIMSTIYYAILSQLPSENSVIKFIEKFSPVLPLPTTLFVLGCTFYLASFLYGGYLLYGSSWSTALLVALFALIFIFIMGVWITMQKFSVDCIDECINDRIQNGTDLSTPSDVQNPIDHHSQQHIHQHAVEEMGSGMMRRANH